MTKTLISKNVDIIVCVLLFIISFSFYSHFVVYNVGGDGVSQYYPAIKFLDEGSLNLWNSLNNQYNTYYFKLPFTDEVIYKWNRSYPTQTLGNILLNAFVMGIFGNNAFFYINPFFASIIVIYIYLITKELVRYKSIAILSSLILFSMPVFLYWAIIPQDIIPATAFLIISIYFIIKFKNNNKKPFLFLSSVFFAYSVFCRFPHFLFGFAYLIYFINKNKKYTINFRKLIYFIIPFLFGCVLIIFLNIKYFGDPWFIGYLRTDYRPSLLGFRELDIPHKYFINGFSLNIFINTIGHFINGTYKIFSPTFFIALIGLIIKFKEKINKRYIIFFLLSFILLLSYYSTLEPMLWKPTNPKWSFSLSLAFFRYMLPIYVISVPFLGMTLLKTYKMIKYNKLVLLIIILITILSITYVNRSITYEGGASLNWYKEINKKIIGYSQILPEKLENDSIILYSTRWAISYTYPHTGEYNWFYYDGIPPKYRSEHTVNIVKKLLIDNKTVYFIKSPYEDSVPGAERVFNNLSENFILEKMPETYFKRMNAIFYQVKMKEIK